MAINLTTFLCLLLLANAVSFARCDNGFEICQSVDYDTILAKKPVDQNFRLGPEGFYAKTESGCYVLDVKQPGFNVEHPALSEAYSSAMTVVNGNVGNAEVNAPAANCSDQSDGKFGDTPELNCYDVCTIPEGDPCTDECDCIFDHTTCTPDYCWDIYICLYTSQR